MFRTLRNFSSLVIMSRRKAVVTKRSEYVDVYSDEESHLKIQPRKRKLPIELESEGSDDCEWEPIQSNPKMMRINRKNPSKVSVLEEHDYDFEMTVDAKKHCTNRNALMARRNRIKKKMYVEKLENTIQELRDNFKSMQKQIHEQNEVIAQVTKENQYLRNVITNSSGLRQILQGVRLAGLANPVDSSTSLRNKPVSPNTNLDPKGTDPFLNDCSDLFSGFDVDSFTDLLSLPVHVTENSPSEDACPSSTTCDSLSNDKWELPELKPIIPVHDYSSNPQVGLCVHIINNTLSVEFCETCNENAYSNLLSNNPSDISDLLDTTQYL